MVVARSDSLISCIHRRDAERGDRCRAGNALANGRGRDAMLMGKCRKRSKRLLFCKKEAKNFWKLVQTGFNSTHQITEVFFASFLFTKKKTLLI
jgi:hypothetical protein